MRAEIFLVFLLVVICASCSTTSPRTDTLELTNFTLYPGGMMEIEVDGHELYSYISKVTFDIFPDGSLRRSEQQQELFDIGEYVEDPKACTARGAEYNQATAWFPHTGFAVYGGKLVDVIQADGVRSRLRKLTLDMHGLLRYRELDAARIEFVYAPCVGSKRVTEGTRLDGYWPRNAKLFLEKESGDILELALPDPMEPFLMLRYTSGAVIPVPMRPVYVSIDLQTKELVVQYQTTFSRKYSLSKIDQRAINTEGSKSENESEEVYRIRTSAMLNELWSCPAPTSPGEVCATPLRKPDPLIFSR